MAVYQRIRRDGWMTVDGGGGGVGPPGPAGPTGPAGPPGPSGAKAGHVSYTFNTNITEPPGTQTMRLNNATQNLATKLWTSDHDYDNLDVTIGLAAILAGHQVYVQDFDDASKWIKFTVTANAIDKGNYFEIPIAYLSSSTASPIPAQKCELQAIAPGAASGILPELEYIASHTLALVDCDAMMRLNSATALALTVPTTATVPIPTGQVLLGYQAGAGAVTVTAAPGVTIRAPGGRVVTIEIYSQFSLYKRALNEWLLTGELA